MELVILFSVIGALVVLDVLAMRFGVDSRDTTAPTAGSLLGLR